MKNQTFGIEIETTGLGRERTARALAALFGTTARHVGRHLDDWKVPMPTGGSGRWSAMGRSPTPPPRWSARCAAGRTSRWSSWWSALCAGPARRPTPSCGIHIHVGLGEHTPQSLRRLVNIVNAKEDLLTQALGISPERRGRWCQPVEPVFLTELNRRKPVHHGGAGTALVPCQRRVQRAGLAAARRFPLRHQPLPPPESARGLFHRAARAPPSNSALQRHTPRGRNQSLHPALPRHFHQALASNPPARRGPSPTTLSTPSGAGSCGWGSSARNSRSHGNT